MLKKQSLFVSAFLILAASFVLINNVNATQILEAKKSEMYVVTDNINDNLYLFGDERVIVNGNVNGDLFVGGGSVEINGKVSNDVYVAGGILTLNNDVGGNVTIAGGQIDIKGNINSNMYVAGGQIMYDGKINGDVLAVGGNLYLLGEINGDLRIAGGSVTVYSNVAGDLLAAGDVVSVYGNVGKDLYMGAGQGKISSEIIGRDLVYYGQQEYYQISSTTKIGGEKKFEEVDRNTMDSKVKPFTKGADMPMFRHGVSLVFSIIYSIGLFILGLLTIKFAPGLSRQTLKGMENVKESSISLLIGVLVMPSAVFVALILMVSVIGWPLLGVLFSLFMVMVYLVTPLAGIAIIKQLAKLFKFKIGPRRALAFGLILLVIVEIIPFFGGLVKLIIFLTVIGSVNRALWRRIRR